MPAAIAEFLVYLGMLLESPVGMLLISYAYPIAYGILIAGSAAYGAAQQRRIENQSKNQYNSTIRDRTAMIRTAESPSPWVVGLTRLSGPIVFVHTTGTYKEYLHLVVALARHECDAIEAIYFGDVELPAENVTTGFVETGVYANGHTDVAYDSVTTNGSGVATLPRSTDRVISVSGTVLDFGIPDDVYYGWSHTPGTSTVTGLPASTALMVTSEYTTPRSLVRVRKHLGQPGQVADADLIAESGGAWTSTDKGVNTCYVYVRIQFVQEVFGQTGIPVITARTRGGKFYDSRKDSTSGGSGTHRANDSTTWQYTTNPSLAAGAYLRDQKFGIRSAIAEVIAAELTTAANICDEDVILFNTGTVAVTSGQPNIVFSDSDADQKVRTGMVVVITSSATRFTITSITGGAANISPNWDAASNGA